VQIEWIKRQLSRLKGACSFSGATNETTTIMKT